MRSLRRITSSSALIPELDGLRFIAIAMVVCYHIWSAALAKCGPAAVSAGAGGWISDWLRHGDMGVELFFIISGFILAVPFLRSRAPGAPKVRIGRYYLRRITRLEPPYILTLVAIHVLAIWLRTPDVADPDFAASFWRRLFYLNNAVTGRIPSLNGVTWSLEVEVQFYLLVPLLASLFCLDRPARRLLLVAVMSLCPLIVCETGQLRLSVLNYAEYFLAGFLLADLYVERGGRTGAGSRGADILAVCCMLLVLRCVHMGPLLLALPWLLFGVAYAGLFGHWTPRLLAQPVISVTGGMCYSIYLIHYPILSFLADRIVRPDAGLLPALMKLAACGLPAIAVVATLFFALVERPCMRPDWPRRLGLYLRPAVYAWRPPPG